MATLEIDLFTSGKIFFQRYQVALIEMQAICLSLHFRRKMQHDMQRMCGVPIVLACGSAAHQSLKLGGRQEGAVMAYDGCGDTGCKFRGKAVIA